jgi:hypothetical protein
MAMQRRRPRGLCVWRPPMSEVASRQGSRPPRPAIAPRPSRLKRRLRARRVGAAHAPTLRARRQRATHARIGRATPMATPSRARGARRPCRSYLVLLAKRLSLYKTHDLQPRRTLGRALQRHLWQARGEPPPTDPPFPSPPPPPPPPPPPLGLVSQMPALPRSAVAPRGAHDTCRGRHPRHI